MCSYTFYLHDLNSLKQKRFGLPTWKNQHEWFKITARNTIQTRKAPPTCQAAQWQHQGCSFFPPQRTSSLGRARVCPPGAGEGAGVERCNSSITLTWSERSGGREELKACVWSLFTRGPAGRRALCSPECGLWPLLAGTC